jgi:hypothetical protein
MRPSNTPVGRVTGFCVGIGNGLILGYLDVPVRPHAAAPAPVRPHRRPLIFASSIAVLFGAHQQTDATHFLFSIPEILWELSLAIYLAAKGFKPDAPILQEPSDTGLAAAR